MILVVSTDRDDHAGLVLERLEAAGAQAALVDLGRFPQRLRLSLTDPTAERPAGVLRWDDGREELALDRCRVVWWRRPQPPELDPSIGDPVHRSFAFSECHAALSGLWASLDVFWVNDPVRDELAARKAFQLKLAREVGLEIPATLITSDPDDAREFVARRGHERTVYKAFSGTQEAWRETRVLRGEETALLDAVALAPVIFQEYMPAAFDLRVTMIEGTAMAAAIDSQSTPYKADYRMHMDDTTVEPFALPEPVEERLRVLMGRLGLVYGAIDMRVTPDGRYIFLEVNPSGQWLFIERRTDLPITETFVRLLVAHDDGGRGSV